MNYTKIDVNGLTGALEYGLAALTAKEEEINALNVFPVPDGDTGKNMRMTYESGLEALKGSQIETVGEAAGVFARGMLFGARGNSGVILSQIFKGIALGLDGCEKADSAAFASAFAEGVKKSYKAVVKPVEGTMLTVFREAAEGVENAQIEDLKEFFGRFEGLCEKSLEKTPEKLAVLKEAGVVDSGGAGLVCIFDGIYSYLCGEKITAIEHAHTAGAAAANAEVEAEFGYCTEFLLKLEEDKQDFEVERLISQLEAIGGESIVALRDGDIVKTHVHVKTPGDVLNIAQKYGEFITIKIENMTVQHRELLKENAVEKLDKKRLRVALVTVASGEGFKDLFYDMGADFVVSGGQSFNPSVEDFIGAFKEVNADKILVLPNNSNVIMTAEQARELYADSEICVVPTRNLAQGYSALSLYNPDGDFQEAADDMGGAAKGVISVELTYAVRGAKCDGVEVSENDRIAVLNGHIAGKGATDEEALAQALAPAYMQGKCVVTLFCGEDATDPEREKLEGFFKQNYPDLEICSMKTGQKYYSFIIAVE